METPEIPSLPDLSTTDVPLSNYSSIEESNPKEQNRQDASEHLSSEHLTEPTQMIVDDLFISSDDTKQVPQSINQENVNLDSQTKNYHDLGLSERDLCVFLAFDTVLQATNPSWSLLATLFDRLQKLVLTNETLELDSSQNTILNDFREFKGESCMKWVKEFRHKYQASEDEFDQKERRLCFLNLTDLIFNLQLEEAISFDSWHQLVDGSLYNGGFRDLVALRNRELSM